ncbi:MAG: prepilin peptidase [Beijerinckiaceae bacterium]|nr:prepilin peptidase [Beijerinckiaceae bacterium]MCI0736469.1 prepilin peptidase [Beijerinckiaceae bacterium]
MTELLIRIALAAILIFVILDDLRNYRIRNEAVAALILLFLLRAILMGQFAEALSHAVFAAVMFAVLLLAYSRGFLGGGDVKLLGAAFLWLGMENSFLFSIFLLAFTILYVLLAKLGTVPKRMVSARTKIPFGPCIGGAWLVTLLGSGSA